MFASILVLFMILRIFDSLRAFHSFEIQLVFGIAFSMETNGNLFPFRKLKHNTEWRVFANENACHWFFSTNDIRSFSLPQHNWSFGSFHSSNNMWHVDGPSINSMNRTFVYFSSFGKRTWLIDSWKWIDFMCDSLRLENWLDWRCNCLLDS